SIPRPACRRKQLTRAAAPKDGESVSTLIRQARLVSIGAQVPTEEPLDIRIGDAVVVEVGGGLLPASDEQVIDADGRWAIPGLWDQHVHMLQWANTLARLDLSGTPDPTEVIRAVGAHIAQLSP